MAYSAQEDDILSYFADVKKAGQGFSARCPAHDDRSSSLVVYFNEDKATIKCLAGCHYLDVLAKAGLPAKLLYFHDQPMHAAAPSAPRPAPQPSVRPVKTPAPDVQETLHALIRMGQDSLATHEEALAYLDRRGLTERTAKRFQLGYSNGLTRGGVRVPRGLMMPCVVGNRVWYIKVRKFQHIRCPQCSQQMLAPEQVCACGFRYQKLSQLMRDPANDVLPANTALNINALYNADSLLTGETALTCEGEIDCMTLSQELGLPVVTLGSVGSAFDPLVWGVYLLNIRRAMVVKDNDTAGQRLTWPVEMFGANAIDAKLPDGVKDPNDLFVKAKRLYSWAVKSILTPTQQPRFYRLFAQIKTWGANDAGAARLAWHDTIQSGRQWTPAELYDMGLREDALTLLRGTPAPSVIAPTPRSTESVF